MTDKARANVKFQRIMRMILKFFKLLPTKEKDLKKASECNAIILKSNPLSTSFKRKWKKFGIYLTDFHSSRLFTKKGVKPAKKHSRDERVANFYDYLTNRSASKPDVFETARCRMTALDDGRIFVELFKKNGLPHSSFEVVKIKVNDLYDKEMREKVFFAITNNKGTFAKKFGFFSYLSKQAKVVLGSSLSNTNLYLNVKKFTFVPQTSVHEFGNQNLITSKGFVVNNYYNLLEAQAFDYLYGQVEDVHKKWETVRKSPRIRSVC